MVSKYKLIPYPKAYEVRLQLFTLLQKFLMSTNGVPARDGQRLESVPHLPAGENKEVPREHPWHLSLIHI